MFELTSAFLQFFQKEVHLGFQIPKGFQRTKTFSRTLRVYKENIDNWYTSHYPLENFKTKYEFYGFREKIH